jgi:hypothetical protein
VRSHPYCGFEGADPAFAAGPPLDGAAERGPAFGGLAGLAGFALARDQNVADHEPVHVVFDGLLAVAAVGGDGPGRLVGPLDDPLHGRGELRAVGRVALHHGVIGDDPVVVAGELGLYPNSTGVPSRPLAIGRASGSCTLTRRVAPSGIVPASRCRACGAIWTVTSSSPARH